MEAAIIVGISTVFATICGPVLAVQAQKYLEKRRGLKDQKMRIFSTLMATRAARLSPDHVQALNMIDLSFYGGERSRRSTETDVLDAWRDYLDHLNSKPSEQTADRWGERQNELFIVMLSAMASDLGLRYDRVLLRNGAYMPKGHTDLEDDQHQLRKLVLSVLAGKQPICMNITGFPADPAALAAQKAVLQAFTDALSGEGALTIKVDVPEPAASRQIEPLNEA